MIPGKDIVVGSTLKLFGEWKVNENPKYTSMGKQFYFKAYELMPVDSRINQVRIEHPSSLRCRAPYLFSRCPLPVLQISFSSFRRAEASRPVIFRSR